MSRSNATAEQMQPVEPRRASRMRTVLPIVLGVLAVINVMFFALALKPAGARAREEHETMLRLQSDIKARRDVVDKLRAIDATLGQAGTEDVQFYEQKFLPRATGFSTIMAEWGKLGKETHTQTGGIAYTLTPVQGHPELNQVEMSTTVQGDYADIIAFINAVEKDPLFLIIDEIAVAGPGVAAGPQAQQQAKTVRLSIRLLTYFRNA